MGLQSALSTALTGLSAAETIIDVVGNNVANANTIGFKSSNASFATQFLNTQGSGSGPTESNGGVNPRQIGLGVITAEINPNFNQGTIQVSNNPSDLAIQGDGFFPVQGDGGELLFTRNGQFKTNSSNELVTITGDRLLGQGVDENFQLSGTTLVPITIPLGARAVAKATENVFFQGTLTPTGDVATKAKIVQTDSLGDRSVPAPTTGGTAPLALPEPGASPTAAVNAGGNVTVGTYRYYVTFYDGTGAESEPSAPSAVVNVGANSNIDVTVPAAPGGAPTNWVGRRLYRTNATGTGTAFRVADLANLGATTVVNDNISNATLATNTQMSTSVLNGRYEYLITFANSLGTTPPSRPFFPSSGLLTVNNGRIKLDGLPAAGTLPSQYDRVNIYRNSAADPNSFYLVEQINPAVQTSYIDSTPDATLTTHPPIDLDGPKISAATTNVVDILRRDGTNYVQLFQQGTLTFTPQKGQITLSPKTFTITNTTKVVELLAFMNESLGIQQNTDPLNPIPNSTTTAGTEPPGASITADGRLRIVGNNGKANAVDISLSGLQLTVGANQANVDMPFGTVQDAVGQGTTADFIAYDSLGIPIKVRVTTVLQSRDGNNTTYRWFADSPDNDPAAGKNIAVGTGLIRFDGNGKLLTVTNSTVSIDRRNVASISPLEFKLNFQNLSGLATENATLAASRQDGSAEGSLSNFVIGADGRVRGVFTNGVTRDLGQVRLARFANPVGLEQRGLNKYASGVNSGLPIIANPSEQGLGSLVPGANEQSNTDIGANLIRLITASTQFRGNTRVITASEQLLDELMNLRR